MGTAPDRAVVTPPTTALRDGRYAVVGLALAAVGVTLALPGCATAARGDLKDRGAAIPSGTQPVPMGGYASPTRDAPRWDLRIRAPRPGVRLRPDQPVRLASSDERNHHLQRRTDASATSDGDHRPAAGALRAAISRRARRLAPCFARVMGVLRVQLHIRSDGRVTRVISHGSAPAQAARCVAARARRWSFGPLPRSVTHRLTLRSMGEPQ